MVDEAAAAAVQSQQLEQLDDTDIYATAWGDAVLRAKREKGGGAAAIKWGGRGQGGRGFNRRTFQPTDVAVPCVRLEYAGSRNSSSNNNTGESRLLLENAHLKLLLTGRVYALMGPNGCGKSTLLRRVNAGKVPGFPPHVSTLYLSQNDDDNDDNDDLSAVDWVLQRFHDYCSNKVQVAGKAHMEVLEAAMEALDVDDADNGINVAKRMEELAEAISSLEDELAEHSSASDIQGQAREALAFMGIEVSTTATTGRLLPIYKKLTEGQRKKVSLALALLCCCSASCDLLLLDEPTNSLDVTGLLQLRQLVETVTATATAACSRRPTTVLLVSHDCDFINDVATDVIAFHNFNLHYYAGNYNNYLIQREQLERHQIRQAETLEKKQEAMQQTLDNLKKKKKSKTITSHKKKMERILLGDNNSSVNAHVVAARQRKRCEDEPEKSIQFRFRNCTSQWHEPLILAVDVGFGYEMEGSAVAGRDKRPPPPRESDQRAFPRITKKDGYLFDCVDLCIQEGGTYCILGENASGKSTLLKILAKSIEPTEGRVLHALNVDVALLDQSHDVARTVLNVDATTGVTGPTATALQYLTDAFPKKTEQEIRGELTAFGLSPKQAGTDVRFLSGGERCRLCMAAAMLRNPQVLCLDLPTADLDVDSVEALVYGIRHWNGTVVAVSHDAHFLRSLDAQCYVLVAEEGKLRRVEGGVDAYLRSFGARR